MEFNAYLNRLFEHIPFPEDSQKTFLALENTIKADPSFDAALKEQCEAYLSGDRQELENYLNRMDALAAEKNVEPHLLDMFFLLRCLPVAEQCYRDAKISEEIFWRGADDLRCKAAECFERCGVWGTFVGGWFRDFYDLKRFALGRFQYVYTHFDRDTYTSPSGFTIHRGDPILQFHIPSSGIPLTDDVRYDSYRRAEAFYKPKFGDRPMILSTSSWLIYPKHREFLPEKSNLLKFMDDFDIFFSEDKPNRPDAWRLFGHWAEYPPEQWPEDTSLRRAYKKWILAGNTAGSGVGFFVMKDGVNITRGKK